MSNAFAIVFPLFGLVLAGAIYSIVHYQTWRYDTQAAHNSMSSETTGQMPNELADGIVLHGEEVDIAHPHGNVIVQVHRAASSPKKAKTYRVLWGSKAPKSSAQGARVWLKGTKAARDVYIAGFGSPEEAAEAAVRMAVQRTKGGVTTHPVARREQTEEG